MDFISFDLERVNCDLCGSKEEHGFIKLCDRLFDIPGTFHIVQCSSCGLLYLNPRPTLGAVKELYEQYYDCCSSDNNSIKALVANQIRKLTLLRRIWHMLCGQYLGEVINKLHGDVLDIGCGTGDLLAMAQNRGCRVAGIELNPNAVEICHQKGLNNVRHGVLELGLFPQEQFDCVTLWHVIEHLPSPRTTLTEIYRILRPGGRLFIYCPNTESYMQNWFKEYWCGWHMPFHFYHFTPSSISQIASRCDFAVGKIKTATSDAYFHSSLNCYIRHYPKSRLRYLTQVARTFVFRGSMAFIYRLFDSCLPGKGESLKVELVKPVSA